MARTQRMPRLGRGFRSRASKLMAVCLGGVVLFSAGQSNAEAFLEGIHYRSLQDSVSGGTQTGPTFQEGVAKCVLTTTGSQDHTDSGATALTLSKGNLSATLVCSGQNNAAVPENLTKVCSPNGKDSADKCKFGTASASEGMEATLQDLLGAGEHVKWKKQESTGRAENSGETWILSLTEGDLPLTDKPFFVGCKAKTRSPGKLAGATDSCKVPIHVEARPSSETNNVVTCAYGQNSNTHALEVELTAEKNAVTIECGSVGSPLPENPTIHYCAPDDGNLDSCTAKKYVDALPMFEESWVKQDEDKSSVTLTIPESGFPVEDQKLRLGCVPQNTSDAKGGAGSSADSFDAKTSNCNVMVTVRASNAISSAISSLQVVAVACGAVAVTGLLAGSL
ncbi:SRS domain-containing protein [Neospora caninum Liverpool]|uniref:SRS domain-containing protein n=1 Tax=Neospora caninum (strain Liverpool) TaxID=572307 RepID=F0VCW1_NEOCL|nr:SRS domain-containing protein [Neospora caninum Liverpool]CBZ51476.1 SRS domain-containing protein [Neospora caninum Liverpool]CEL65426.1 TPA: SRS domain-containing protein [Neospora caninum Liverpool]|eukprot:XP_003881509.1 SRS domain-containing protein [Neospora caninum Liverpool]